eukprot:6036218-Pyramimonas_sp.AAC.1
MSIGPTSNARPFPDLSVSFWLGLFRAGARVRGATAAEVPSHPAHGRQHPRPHHGEKRPALHAVCDANRQIVQILRQVV